MRQAIQTFGEAPIHPLHLVVYRGTLKGPLPSSSAYLDGWDDLSLFCLGKGETAFSECEASSIELYYLR
jgi:hypothetical protein